MTRCHGCQAEWTGGAPAHCRSCHRTFGTTKLFDLHRRNHTCLHPEAVEMVLDDKGIWRLAA